MFTSFAKRDVGERRHRTVGIAVCSRGSWFLRNQETRLSVDYRGLSQVTRAEHYPLPFARSKIFETLGEAKVFSCFDCQQGY